MMRPGPTNSLTDVAGLRVGHATRRDQGWLTGCTVVVAPDAGAVAGVDVRGGAPGTRETDLLDPRNLVDRVNAVVLTGGSAFGLAAADGVVQQLYAAGLGWPMGEPGQVVPILPAAVLFDLGRGGEFANAPTAADGADAYASASTDAVLQGCAGAGTGARAGGLKGAIGSASAVLDDGTTVAALVALNSFGAPYDERTGELLAARHGLGDEFAHVGTPSVDELDAARDRAAAAYEGQPVRPGMATTIGVIATDATLTKAQCQKTSGLGHDGLARAVHPVHTLLDGDTLFTLATGERPAPDLAALHALMVAAGDCVTRAVGHAVLAAESVSNGAVDLRSYRDAFPSAVRMR
ncbi:putative pantetheine hydrolase [Phycicoccus badiiscoriae]|uniref:Putative pantetheine hydrolase n=1 Tax=Pedococcus badiiscoriae TaxID=642776 RepID=A0A852WEN5_9MICO|nr:P1 family peptidase [Pedococcus badiiscoriae]NYG07210.1 putative pantetheine hydrolase [Pedococcus badiiscoriae]